MAKSDSNYLARTARIAQNLERRRVRSMELRHLLERVERTGLVVAGEAWMLNELEDRLERASQALSTLEQVEDIEPAADQLSEIEELLSDLEWEVADTIFGDLTEKARSQKERLGRVEDQIAEWQSRIGNLEAQLEEARELRAPVIVEAREILRLQALVEQAERALREQQFGILDESLTQLEAETEKPQELADQISTKVASARDFARQSDLLLLQSPAVDQRFQYTVLLRTPSVPGTHGINIQGSSTLVEQDRKLMSHAIDEVTKAINVGLARQFSLRQQPLVIGETEGAVVDSVPGVALEDEDDTGNVAEDADEPLRNLRPIEPIGERVGPGDVNELARDVGDLMYRLFMPEQMQRYLNDTPCSVTITTNDLELPWELMWYEDNFLCLDRPVARMPMGHAFPRGQTQPIRTGGKLRFLLIYADPEGNLPSAGQEIERIKEGLEEDWKEQIEIDVLDREDAQGRELNRVLRAGRYDVIHFAGHASFHPDDPDLSGLLLHDNEVFFAQKIRRLLEGRPLVFLNACQSGRTANEQRPQTIQDYLQKPAEGLASSFIYGGALGCIGALWPIYDRPAADFALQFYSKVLEGYMIGDAMRLARQQNREMYPDSITWAAFVLYGDPTFTLVD